MNWYKIYKKITKEAVEKKIKDLSYVNYILEILSDSPEVIKAINKNINKYPGIQKLDRLLQSPDALAGYNNQPAQKMLYVKVKLFNNLQHLIAQISQLIYKQLSSISDKDQRKEMLVKFLGPTGVKKLKARSATSHFIERISSNNNISDQELSFFMSEIENLIETFQGSNLATESSIDMLTSFKAGMEDILKKIQLPDAIDKFLKTNSTPTIDFSEQKKQDQVLTEGLTGPKAKGNPLTTVERERVSRTPIPTPSDTPALKED